MIHMLNEYFVQKIKDGVIPYLSKCNMYNCTKNCNKCNGAPISFTLRYVL